VSIEGLAECKASANNEDSLSAKHQRAVKGIAEYKASASNLRRIQVEDIVKKVEDYLKTYSSAGMDISLTLPPIPPPLESNTRNPSSPNRVDTIPTDNTNNTTTNNVAQNVVDENLPQLLDYRGGSHVIYVLEFNKEDFTSWKVRFLVYLDGLEHYLLENFKDGPFVPMSSLSNSTNPLPKPQKQWSHANRRLANQDKRLKSIIVSCLANDIMKTVIKCKTTKAMWNDLI
ncbi:hypothetical protein Tco_1390978, partial [Tanacetum coccineum]